MLQTTLPWKHIWTNGNILAYLYTQALGNNASSLVAYAHGKHILLSARGLVVVLPTSQPTAALGTSPRVSSNRDKGIEGPDIYTHTNKIQVSLQKQGIPHVQREIKRQFFFLDSPQRSGPAVVPGLLSADPSAAKVYGNRVDGTYDWWVG